MSPDDALFRYRVRVFHLAEEMGSVRAACRAMGIHPSTFYRWRKLVRRGGLEMLRPRERRTGLRQDLDRFLTYHNTDRAHTGRLTEGKTPEQVIGKANVWPKKK